MSSCSEVYISAYQFGYTACQDGTFATQSYSIPRTKLGEVEETVATAAQPLVASNGSVKVIDTCKPVSGSSGTGETEDPPPGAPVCGLMLDELKADLDDVSVAGVSITGVAISNVNRARIATDAAGTKTIATGGLTLAVTGAINGAESMITVANTSPWTVELGDSSVKLVGDVALAGTDLGNNPIVVTTTMDIVAPKATDAELACANAGPLQKLFGFESRPLWQSTNATLTSVKNPKTQGCAAFGVSGQGYLTINSARFSTAELIANSAISVDVFVPTNQPNPWWYGDIQMTLSCPSGNVSYQYIGLQPLTGLPRGVFSTRRLPLPAEVKATLGRGLMDCSLGVVLNVNATGQPWALDNLRLTP